MNFIRKTIHWISSYCKIPKVYTPEDLVNACKNGDSVLTKKILDTTDFPIEVHNKALFEAVCAGYPEPGKLIIQDNEVSNLDDCLKEACIRSKYSVAEMLVEMGARTIVGHRVARSPNIIRMLYRYEQNSENIN